MLFLLVLGQRDPECNDFDGRGSASAGVRWGELFPAWVDFGASWLKKTRGIPMRLSQNIKISNISNFCLNQHLKTSNLGEQGSVRDNLGWQWNEY